MKIISIDRCLLLIFLFLFSIKLRANNDSTQIVVSKYFALSTSYSANKNWQGKDFRNLSFATNSQFRYNANSNIWNQAHVIIADLSYLKFIDSLWIKNQDKIQMNFLWSKSENKIKHSYTCIISSQFLPKINYLYDSSLERNIKQKTGGFLLPFSAELGYGGVLTLWKTSTINFAFATIRVYGYPRTINSTSDIEEHFASSHKNYFDMSYGMSIQTNIQKVIDKHLEWVNTSRFFANQFDKDHVNFDLNNRFIIKLWKSIQLRLDTRITYAPVLNEKIQLSQEVLIGLFYQKENRRKR